MRSAGGDRAGGGARRGDVCERAGGEAARHRAAFRRGEWELAAGEYGAALERYAGRALSSEQRAEKVILHSNRAEAFLKLDEFQAARECATAALEIDPAHGKSLHTQACAGSQAAWPVDRRRRRTGRRRGRPEGAHAPRRRRGRG